MKQIRTTIESPYEPNDNGALWLDTSNPDAPILKAFTNGKWQATIGEKVTEIDSDSTDEEIPSAKAVNDRITVLADKVGVDLSKYEEYFTIEATVDDTTVYFYRSDYGQDRGDYTVEVSTDEGATWVSKTATLYEDGGTAIADLAAKDRVLIRGTNQVYGGYDDEEDVFVNFANFWADMPCYVYGNIMSLIGGDDFARLKSMEDRGFAYFFSDYDGSYNGSWVLSKDGTELMLPATTLENGCYSNMFDGSLITIAPVLPATTLAYYCYGDMFTNCTSLTAAPELPATTLMDSCYRNMFNHCTSLTVASELPATTLADYCYCNMFCNCTSLMTAPMLPATTLIVGCYSGIFSGCSSLTTAPALPVTVLANGCYTNMFSGCISLRSAPTLPATNLADNCYAGMFYNCTSLTSAPDLTATILADSCYERMFRGCINLISAPTLPATTLADWCYSDMFSGCTSLTSAPELPATVLMNDCYRSMFYGCTNLSYIKALFTTTPSNTYTQNWVYGVKGTGTFVKSASATWSVTGTNGVPNGWTIKEGESTGNVPVTTAPMDLTEAQKEQVRENIGIGVVVKPIKMLSLPEEGDELEDVFNAGMTLSEIEAASRGERNGVVHMLGYENQYLPISMARYYDEDTWEIQFCSMYYTPSGVLNGATGRYYRYENGTFTVESIEI